MILILFLFWIAERNKLTDDGQDAEEFTEDSPVIIAAVVFVGSEYKW